MTTDRIQALLERAAAADRAEVALGPRATPQCIPLSRIVAAHQAGDWTAAERAHLEGCPYCQAAERKCAEPIPPLADTDRPAVPSELVARLAVWAEPAFGWDARLVRGARAEAPVAPTGPASVAWRVGDEPGLDGGTVPLAPELVARCYDDPTVQRVAVVVAAVPLPDGLWAPEVELDPGPNRDVVVVTVTFADGTVRYFAVPPNEPGPLYAAAAAADPIPQIAVGAYGDGWRGTVALE